jgi:GntR family transcriptional regulator
MRLKLEPASPIPTYLQIVEQVRNAIVAGTLKPDEELPSVRALASVHLINPNTVARAYMELEREGLLEKKRGMGTYVCPQTIKNRAAQKTRIVGELLDGALKTAVSMRLSATQVRMLFEERLKRARDLAAEEETES